jgi:hypothetical protein
MPGAPKFHCVSKVSTKVCQSRSKFGELLECNIYINLTYKIQCDTFLKHCDSQQVAITNMRIEFPHTQQDN